MWPHNHVRPFLGFFEYFKTTRLLSHFVSIIYLVLHYLGTTGAIPRFAKFINAQSSFRFVFTKRFIGLYCSDCFGFLRSCMRVFFCIIMNGFLVFCCCCCCCIIVAGALLAFVGGYFCAFLDSAIVILLSVFLWRIKNKNCKKKFEDLSEKNIRKTFIWHFLSFVLYHRTI